MNLHGTKHPFSAFILVSGLLTGSAFAEEKINWPADKSCVAWQTKKTMFLFKHVIPIGINCEIAVKDTVAAAEHQISVSAPIAKFDSGEPSRDKEVLEILKASVQPDLEFISKPLEEPMWASLFKGELKEIKGVLKIGGKAYPVTAVISVSGEKEAQIIEGSVPTTFTAFEITPPRVAGGVVAKVEDVLNLSFKVLAKDIQR